VDVPDDQALDQRKEAQEAYLAERERLHAKKEQMLDTHGVYELGSFSVPGEMRRCEHRFLRKMVLGGQPDYYCDDCETELSFPNPYGRPKQHIVPHAMMKLGWAMKYEGPRFVADTLLRPHLRLDLKDHPSLPPIEIIREQKDQWREVMRILEEYEIKALTNGHKAEEANAERDGMDARPERQRS
jgi:hypothetical protein